MSKHSHSMLFVPAARPDMIAKAARSAMDFVEAAGQQIDLLMLPKTNRAAQRLHNRLGEASTHKALDNVQQFRADHDAALRCAMRESHRATGRSHRRMLRRVLALLAQSE